MGSLGVLRVIVTTGVAEVKMYPILMVGMTKAAVCVAMV